jgi:hypothetical protein
VKIASAIAAMSLTVFMLSGATLPRNGPVPEQKPEAAEPAAPQDQAPPVQTAPVPQPKPEEAKPEQPKSDDGKQAPAAPGKPEDTTPETAKPDASQPADQKAEDARPETPKAETLEDQHLTIEPESDADHADCIKELQSLGVVFKEIPRIDDGNGCGIDKPIVLSEALPGIKVKPEATLRCPTARALAHWMKESVIPAAAVAAKDQGKITTINQASAYICRLRNSAETGKISEHARGNAIDVASFSFEKGEDIAVKPRREDSTLTGAFQRTVSASGCLYFSTVLDPESDAAHETHFHLDVLERKGGYRYCH